MTHNEFSFNAFKTDFFGQYWLSKESKGVIILIHGMGEHSGRYTHVAEKLLAENFSVISYDNFGHGKTSGKRGHNPNFKALLDVISLVIEKAKELEPQKPLFLYGHSMGGNLVINYVLKRENSLTGVVATSPFLKLAFQPPAWKMTLGKLLQKIAPSITLGNELDANHVSRDPEEVAKYNNDPLVHDKISPNYSLTILETGEWAIKNAKLLKTPMFVLHGTDDKIIDHKGAIDFTKNTKLASLKLIDGGYHELHNDICKDDFLQEVSNWLQTKV